ncbi:MAG: hypothetical protein NT080_02275 [Spirochaetes bacterium]|nr:hypothetical protein [Spirochaetota bacterium]
MEKYRSAKIGDHLISLATKITIIGLVIQRLNESLRLMNLELGNRSEYLFECASNGYAFSSQDRMLPYLLVLDAETFIFEARSSFDMLVKLADLLHSTYAVFSTSITKANIAQLLAESGRSVEWIALLKAIRDIGIHERAPWIGISTNGNGRNPALILVFDDTHNVPASGACFAIDTLIAISKGINELFAFVMHKSIISIAGGA